ncbi:NAD(P)-dependent oxidoreductase [Sphingobium fuliginis]|nr:NAD(P)-binding domain-containing protein [Sphingobium fuliginis]
MAEHIHRAGFALTVSDPDPAVRQRFDAMGIATCVALADIQSVDAALVIVGTDEQMHGVARGLRAAAAPPRYLVIMSTTAPAEIAAIERQFADCGTHVVDAPISGAVMAARRAELTVLVGAAKDDFDALQPVFAAVGSAIVHCGKTGAGQMTKVVNNIIAISNQYVAAEAYRLAIEHGLELDRLLPALDLGSGRNFLSRRGATECERRTAPGRKRPKTIARSTLAAKRISTWRYRFSPTACGTMPCWPSGRCWKPRENLPGRTGNVFRVLGEMIAPEHISAKLCQ